MRNRRGLFVLTHLLGNATHSRVVVDAVSRLDWIDATIVPFASDDFRAYATSLPKTRLGKPFEAARCVAAKVQAEVHEPTSFDFIYVNAIDFAVGLSRQMSSLPAIV